MFKIYTRIKNHANIVYEMLLGLYLLRIISQGYLLQAEFIGYLLGIMAVLFLIISLPQLKGTMRVLVYLMLISGTVMFFSRGQGGIGEYLLGLQGMANLLCIFMIIEFIGFPVALMDLKPFFRPLVYAAKKPTTLFGLLTMVSMFIGSVINMAVIPLIYYSIWDSLKERGVDYSRYLGTALKRGLAISLLWTPFGIMMAIILEYSGVLWIQMAAVTLPLSIFALLVSFLAEHISFRRRVGSPPQPSNEGEKPPIDSEFWRSLKPLIGYVLCLIVFVLFLNIYLSMIDTLIVTAVLIPTVWALLTGKKKEFSQQAKTHFRKKVPGLGEPFSLFIAAGVFTQGLQAYGFESLVNDFMGLALGVVGAVGILMLIVFVIMFASWLGLHPMVSLVLISQNLSFDGSVVPSLYYAIAMMIGGSLSNLTSPISAVTLVTAGIFKANPFEVGVKWNFLFVSLFLIALPFILGLRFYFGN